MIETDWCRKKPSQQVKTFIEFHLKFYHILRFFSFEEARLPSPLVEAVSQPVTSPISRGDFNPGICVETALEKGKMQPLQMLDGMLWTEENMGCDPRGSYFIIQSLQTSMSSLRPRKSHVEALSDFRFESWTWDTALKTLVIRICEVNVGWNDSRFGHLESEKS